MKDQGFKTHMAAYTLDYNSNISFWTDERERLRKGIILKTSHEQENVLG